MNRRREAELAVKELWKDMSAERPQDYIVWFHSGMSAEFREDRTQQLKEGKLWGIVCPDAVGMVSV